MKTSDAGLKFIMRWEGTLLKPYNDIAGIPTIGVGHVILPGEHFTEITMDQVMGLLRKDIASAEAAIAKGIKVAISQNQFDALASFIFNNGAGAFLSSTLLRLLNAGSVQAAADEFPKWCHAKVNGKLTQAAGLLRRRNEERAVFLTPDPAKVVIDVVSGPSVIQEENAGAPEAPRPPQDALPVETKVEPSTVTEVTPEPPTSAPDNGLTVPVPTSMGLVGFIMWLVQVLATIFGGGKKK